MNQEQQDALRTELLGAFTAVNNGTASQTQQALHSAVISALSENLDDQQVVDVISAGVGPFANVYETPWDELSPIKRWIRNAARDADRAVPALGDMQAVYRALVETEQKSGPGLKLGPGVNIIGLDRDGRRWLTPKVSYETVNSIAAETDPAEVRNLLAGRGSVSYSWSIARTFYVPNPDTLRERLPLPTSGKYLMVYRGSVDIVTKAKFNAAAVRLINDCNVADLLIWDDVAPPATLWSVRAGFGHSCGNDIDSWSPEVAASAQRLREQFS